MKTYVASLLAVIAAIVASLAVAPIAAAQDRASLAVSPERLRDTAEQLSAAKSAGEASNWQRDRLRQISKACGGCLELAPTDEQGKALSLSGSAVAVQYGAQRRTEVVIVQASADFSDHPDPSASAMVLEVAQHLSQHSFPATIIYALHNSDGDSAASGAKAVADWAKAQGYQVKAVLNNSAIGAACNSAGECDRDHLRVFSEGLRADATPAYLAQQRLHGGENDAPSRNLSRWLSELGGSDLDSLQTHQIWRPRSASGADGHTPFLTHGYPAVHITSAMEERVNATRIDYNYLQRATNLNLRALKNLATAPLPPRVKVLSAPGQLTEVFWDGVEGATSYFVVGRRNNARNWTTKFGLLIIAQPSPGEPAVSSTEDMHDFAIDEPGDNWIFGVYACGGAPVMCSPTASAVPGGEFAPLQAAEAAQE